MRQIKISKSFAIHFCHFKKQKWLIRSGKKLSKIWSNKSFFSLLCSTFETKWLVSLYIYILFCSIKCNSLTDILKFNNLRSEEWVPTNIIIFFFLLTFDKRRLDWDNKKWGLSMNSRNISWKWMHDWEPFWLRSHILKIFYRIFLFRLH